MPMQLVFRQELQGLLVDRPERAPTNLSVQRNMKSLTSACWANPAELDLAAALTDHVETEPTEDPDYVLPAKRAEPTRHG